MMLHFHTIDELAGAAELVFLALSVETHVHFVLFFVFREDGRQELEVATVQLEVDKLVDELAHLLSVALSNLVYFKVLDIW